MNIEVENKKFYTAGLFAKKAGVTIRTIRYYDKKGLLVPSTYTPKGYRLYSEYEFARLQKILTLKFLGFSLEDIKNAILNDREEDFKQSLGLQKRIIQDRIDHLSLIVKSINETECMLKEGKKLDWGKFVNIIKAVNMEDMLLEQYNNSSNLKARLNLHEKFSINKYGWHRWIFDKMQLLPGARILELGCGDGSLWIKNLDRLPEDCEYVLSDISKGMLKDAKRNLKNTKDKFSFKIADAQNIPFENESFDVVVANNMLFYMGDRNKALSEIKRVLKSGGGLFASTTGKNHMKELIETVSNFDNRIVFSQFDPAEEFGLENGRSQLEEWFRSVSEYKYEDALDVKEVEDYIDYVYSTHGNAPEIIREREQEFRTIIQRKLEKDGSIFITKNSGLFEGRK
jgi:ubiquinone/menaquinone biosynthesis C-methylase UbiE/DNA-binding transcriptional MerR regulator